jgi:hypothetical protein
MNSLRRQAGLRAEQEHENSHDQQRCHGCIGCEPANAGGDHQHARPRDQHGDARAGLDHPRARPLKIEREDFDTPGINNDVLARGKKRHEQR